MRWVAGLVVVAAVLVSGGWQVLRERALPCRGEEQDRPTVLSGWKAVVAYGLCGLGWGLGMFALQGEAGLIVVGSLFFGPSLYVMHVVAVRWRDRSSTEVSRG